MSKPQELNKQEQELVELGEALAEMRLHRGWLVVQKWLENRAFHSWVNPRDFRKEDEWVWAEINAFHSADVAKQILEDIEAAVATAKGLRQKEAGELDENLFQSMFSKLKK